MRTAPLRVLVVDDCRDRADSLCYLLRLWGHEPTAAYGEAEAIDRAAAGVFEVVLLDLGRPGWEVARRVRAQPGMAGAFLVALTGYADTARRAGCDACLVKPLKQDDLARLLDAVRAGVAVV